ncbi:hypothetical protein [Streptomyces sp. URMC 125]|uniref:hypothetical protein n=1 Tax=Streptomyces sp. URMC 125 TaxID=3423419 RepID=UPI003F193BC3
MRNSQIGATGGNVTGYQELMDVARMSHDGDSWGTAMEWLFGIAVARFVWDGTVMPEFRPSPLLEDREYLSEENGDGWAECYVWDLLMKGEITREALDRAYAIFSRYADIAKACGLAY